MVCSSEDVHVSFVFPEAMHDEIVYNTGVAVQSHPAARKFEAFVMSEAAAPFADKRKHAA
jgi:ABC-type molybdate transport system substrate-binding protein